jgi:hypothetical protein
MSENKSFKRGSIKAKIAKDVVGSVSRSVSRSASQVGNLLTSLLPAQRKLPSINYERKRSKDLKIAKERYNKLGSKSRQEMLNKAKSRNNSISKKAAASIMYKKYRNKLTNILSTIKDASKIPKSSKKLISKILEIEAKYPELKRRNGNNRVINNVLNQHLIGSNESLLGKAHHSWLSLWNQSEARSRQRSISKSGSESGSAPLSRASTLTNFTNLVPKLKNRRNALRELEMNHTNSNYSLLTYNGNSNNGNKNSVEQERGLLSEINLGEYESSKRHTNISKARNINRELNPNIPNEFTNLPVSRKHKNILRTRKMNKLYQQYMNEPSSNNA